MSRKIVWSYGGGKQSAAIAALIVRGKLPKPDAIVISDTERERSATWRYLDAVIAPALREIGLEVIRIPKSQFATVDLFSAKGDVLIPAYTTKPRTENYEIVINGNPQVFTQEYGGSKASPGKLPTYCSNEWKRRVVIRWMAANGYKPAEMWLGISTDEAHRMKNSDAKWVTHRYPLIDLLMSREDCKRVVAKTGWPEAPKSTCKMCPHLSDSTWYEMQQDDPQDFAEAVQIEREIQRKDANIFLHRSGQPLDQINFNYSLPGVFDGCDSGMCWT